MRVNDLSAFGTSPEGNFDLTNCAHAAVKRKDSFLAAQFARIQVHRGKKRAHVAVAHSLLIAIYAVFKSGSIFRDSGYDYYNQFNRERKIAACLKKLKASDWEQSAAITPVPL